MLVTHGSPLAQQKSTSDPALVKQGEYLARAGDCIACHTKPGGKLFAGGRAMPTPFGTLYSTNITPDPEAGIGKSRMRSGGTTKPVIARSEATKQSSLPTHWIASLRSQ